MYNTRLAKGAKNGYYHDNISKDGLCISKFLLKRKVLQWDNTGPKFTTYNALSTPFQMFAHSN